MPKKLRNLKGDVRIKRAGEFRWEKAREDDLILPQDQIKTARGARVDVDEWDATGKSKGRAHSVEEGSLAEMPGKRYRKPDPPKPTWKDIVKSIKPSKGGSAWSKK